MLPIIIPFTTNELGRVLFDVQVSTADSKSLKTVDFKLDYGSDFTTLSCEALDLLGYSYEYLKNCPLHDKKASLAADEMNVPIQYITNVTIKFGYREIQNCRVFFALDTGLRSLFGTDLLKYFNANIDFDDEVLKLYERRVKPGLAKGEKQIQICSIENG
jgi:hypothetical protein